MHANCLTVNQIYKSQFYLMRVFFSLENTFLRVFRLHKMGQWVMVGLKGF